jgi:sirohydrochlorin cobaltochelatase
MTLVNHGDFGDAGLVILGHGTTLNAESAAPVYQHAKELRDRRYFAEVREAFWKQEPQVANVLGAMKSPRVFLVPLFISEGFFSEQVIPEALGFSNNGSGKKGRIQERGGQKWIYCRPVGTHPSMTRVLLARAQELVQRFPFPRPPRPNDITLFIAGHGTDKNENSRRVVEEQVERIRAMHVYGGVELIFLEEEPRIESCYQRAKTRNLVIVPFFISDGLHVREDIPVLLGEAKRVVQERLKNGKPTWRNPTEKQGKLVWYSSSVGTDQHVADVIMERVREAAENQ